VKFAIITIIALLLAANSQAQEKKSIEVLKIETPMTIDGVLDEAVYKLVKPATDFVQLQPYNGKPSFQPTEVYFFYDQTAIYVGAMLYDSAPDSIFNLLTERDNTGMADYFGVYIDPYNQGQVAYGFFITPAGVQIDLKATKSDGDNEDGNWNAVWESKTRITDKGWTVEMRIPYSALRFSEKAGSIWGLNMFRNIRRYNSNNSWNFIDRTISGFIHQEGQMTGIKEVKPPVRLSFSPYISTYYEPGNNKTSSSFLYKGGMDLKYGISESFTLDMMLIPDFGQIQSDDKQLNLSPYELYYSEKRQFFTEGTELFQRGNIFYSRRIGASPKFSASDSLHENEIVDYNPSETQLVNATKISGRTPEGWGVGFLNAMSLKSYARLKDTLTGVTRKTLVQPFTNYNVFVIDKSLKNNSYVSLINTNESMVDNSFSANVTATEFQLRDKSKTFAIKGKGGISTRNTNPDENGFYTTLGLEKNKGKLQFGLGEYLYSDKYNPNDLGYLQRNNISTSEVWMYYQVIVPFWIIREYNFNPWWDYNRIYNPSTVYDNEAGYNFNVIFKNNYSFNSNGGFATNKYDYFEPRVKDRYFFNPHLYWYNFNLNTDPRKPVNFYFHYGHTNQPTTDQYSNYGDASADMRVGQHFDFNYTFSFNYTVNGVGYVDKNSAEDSIIFAKRNVSTLSNIFAASYVITNKASLSLRVRHYWSGVVIKDYYLLQTDGRLKDYPTYPENKDQNYNAFTIDMLFRWIFAPGSELSLAWKSSSYADQDLVIENYWSNLQNSWLNKANSISLKVLYYIDYNSLKKKKVS
jgi:hypothetical protein